MSVRYGDEPVAVKAVSDVTFGIDEGEAVGLIGESGCGKSTTARAIVGLLPASARQEGSIRFRDRELTSATEPQLQQLRGKQIALVSQDPAQALNPVLTIGTQIAEVLRSHENIPRAEVKRRVLETLTSVGFDSAAEISRRYAHQLSGGQRQRAAIAQAIACRPALLIADEATSKLDPRLKTELLGLLNALRTDHGMAVLMITHEPAVAASFCDRLIVMYAGEIVECGPKNSVLRQPLHPYTQALIELARERRGIHRSGSRFNSIDGEPEAATVANRCSFERRCPDRMPDCATRHPVVTHASSHDVRCLKYE